MAHLEKKLFGWQLHQLKYYVLQWYYSGAEQVYQVYCTANYVTSDAVRQVYVAQFMSKSYF